MTLKAWTKALQVELDAVGGGTIEVTKGGHLELRLASNGSVVFASRTPSDRMSLMVTRSKIRSAARGNGWRGQPFRGAP